jgi:hypothetical protein
MMLPLLSLLTPAPIAPVPLILAHKAEPAIIRPTLQITTKRFTRYKPAGRKEPIYGQWSWVPRGEFSLTGPLPGGSQIIVNFTKPDGSPWLSLPCQTPEITEGEWGRVQIPDLDEDKAATFSGTLGFQIVLKNELTGSKKILYTGKYVVKTFHSPFDKAANATEFYVDHDWLLPLGYLSMNTQISDEAPVLETHVWLRGQSDDDHIAAYIFYKGKQIASSKHSSGGGGSDEITIGHDQLITTPGMQPKDPAWHRVLLTCMKIRLYRDQTKLSANNYSAQHFLATNPGDYEIKITRDGKLIRSASFTVGTDGKIVNTGLGTKLNTIWYGLPIKVEASMEVGANLTSYKTGAFYGNPIPGFIAP